MKASVSSTLKIILWYFLIGIFGTICCSAVYMIYSLCINMVAGDAIAAFSGTFFLKGLITCAAPVFELSSILLVFYQIRHPSRGPLPLITYAILGLLSWFLIVPGLNMLSLQSAASGKFDHEPTHISSGYFRDAGPGVLFYSRVDDYDVADGVCITPGMGITDTYVFENQKLEVQQEGFQDSLIKESLEADIVLKAAFAHLCWIFDLQLDIIQRGWLSWIWFAFMGIAILSSIGLRNCSRWRLLNILAVIICVLCILIFNSLCFSPASFMARPVGFINGALSFLWFIDNPFALIFNILVTVLLLILGIIFDGSAKKTSEGGY